MRQTPCSRASTGRADTGASRMASDQNLEPVGLIGTGLFGSALAERVLMAGYPLRVHNRTREKAEPLLAQGAKWSDNPLQDCERVIFSLFTTEQVAEVLEQMQSGLRAQQIILDTSTSD